MCKVTSKVFLTILGILFWAAAAGLIYVGTWVYIEYRHYEQISKALYTLVPAAVMIGMGILLFFLGIIGCVGAFKEQRCLLALFFSTLLVIFVGIVAAGVMGYVYRHDVDSAVHDGIQSGLDHYANTSTWRTEVDFMQQRMKCCGSYNYTDWLATEWHHQYPNVSYPASCCDNSVCHYNAHNDTALFRQGCYDLVKTQFLSHLGIIFGVSAAFAGIMMLGMVCVCVLFCGRRDTLPPYIGLQNPDGQQV